MPNCPHCNAALSDGDVANTRCPQCGGSVGKSTWQDVPSSPTLDIESDALPPFAGTLDEMARTLDSDTFDSHQLDSAGADPAAGEGRPASAKTTPGESGAAPTLDGSAIEEQASHFGATIDSGEIPPDEKKKEGTLPDRASPTIDGTAGEQEDVEQRLEGIWGQDDGLSEPHMTIKSQPGSDSAQTSQSTLVIQERALRKAADQQLSLADYELLGVLGEGGMGVVYTARQASIDREVALKMLRSNLLESEGQRRKFLSEAVVTGELDHPNIVPIYDLGRNSDGTLFYSMKKVQGTPWSHTIRKKSLIENLDVWMKVADAVGFAHARGVIHRDLKPENVMLGEFGEVLVLDWGLAVATADHQKSANVSTDLSMAGTPAYMAPEQAVGPVNRIGKHSDIYLLGAMLYEIVTGKPPHPGGSVRESLKAVVRNVIAPTEKRGELVEIARCAMATRPEDRYKSVRALQDAVRQYQSHSESIALSERAQEELRTATQSDDYSGFARAVFAFEEALSLWPGNETARAGVSRARLHYAASAHRKADYDLGLSLLSDDDPAHAEIREQLVQSKQERDARLGRLRTARRAMIALAALVFVAVTTGIVLVSKFWHDAENQAEIARQQKEEADHQRDEAGRQRDEAGRQRDLADLRRHEAEYEAYTALIGMGAAKIDDNAFQQAQLALADCPAELRGWEWRRLMYVVQQGQGRRLPLGERGECLAYDSAGRRLATGSRGGVVRIWDVSGDQAAGNGGAAQEPLVEYKLNADAYVAAVAFSPAQPKLLAVGSNAPDAYLRLWNCDTGETRLLGGPQGHTAAVVSTAFSRDGTRLLTASLDNTARLWDVASGKPLVTYRGHSWYVWSAVFSPDEKHIATASEDGTVRIWDTESGQEWRSSDGRQIPFAGHRGPVYAVAFLPRPVASAEEQQPLLQPVVLKSDGGRKLPDADFVASAGYDTRVLLWRPEELEPFDYKKLLADEQVPETPFVELTGHTAAVHDLSVSPDGKRLLSASYDHTLRVWYAREEDAGYTIVRRGTLDKELRGHDGPVTAAVFDPVDGDVVASAGFDGTARVWNIGQYYEQRPLPGIALRGHAEAVLSARFSHDGSRIATASRDRTAKTWRVTDGAELVTFREGHEYLASKALFFPDGEQLLTAAVDGTVRIWNVETGAEVHRLDGTGYRAAVALSPDGRWVLTGSDIAEAVKRDDGSQRLLQVAQLWDAATGRKLRNLPGHKAPVTAAAFAPEGRFAFTGDDNGVGILWNVEQGRQVARLEFHLGSITDALFVPKRSLLLTASIDGTVCQWNLSDVAAETNPAAKVAVPEPLYDLKLKHPATVTSLALAPDGRLLTGCEDGEARLWELDAARLVWQTASSASADARGAETATATATGKADVEDARSSNKRPNVNAVAIAPSGRQAVAVDSVNNIVRLLDVETGREILTTSADGRPDHFLDLRQHGALGWSAIFTPDGQRVVTVGGNEARLWDMQGTELASFGPHRPVAFASFSPDDGRIVTAGWDNSARIWDAQTGAALLTLANRAENDKRGDAADSEPNAHTAAVNCAVYSPDAEGKQVLTASDDNTLRLWDAETGRVLSVFNQDSQGHRGGITRALFFRDGSRRFASAARDGTVAVWSVENREKPLLRIEAHAAAVLDLALSPDERFLISGSADNTARIFNVADGRLLLTLEGHTGEVSAVAFGTDVAKLRVLTGSADRTAKLWDVSTLLTAKNGEQPKAKELLTLKGHVRGVTSVAFSPDGRIGLTSGRDGISILWPALNSASASHSD